MISSFGMLPSEPNHQYKFSALECCRESMERHRRRWPTETVDSHLQHEGNKQSEDERHKKFAAWQATLYQLFQLCKEQRYSKTWCFVIYSNDNIYFLCMERWNFVCQKSRQISLSSSYKCINSMCFRGRNWLIK